ncbi:MAG: phenylalanine--tRNA ligase subunit beta [Aquificae bacterium]|nr:phenylalanine--tRNA ligase subunit beta [Aquificota bacterium]
MKVPFSWLSEFVDLRDATPERVAEELTLKSAETEVTTFGIELDGVVVAKVLKVEPHPNDARLKVVTVEVKSYRLRVVTSDLTVKEGELLVLALPHAKVGDRCVTKREVKGVRSEGLLLTAADLGLEDAQEGLLRLDEGKPGQDAAELLGFGEKLLELDITPNRGDLLSVRGVAREVSALLNLPKKNPSYPEYGERGSLEVSVESPDDCDRYRGALLELPAVKSSPLFIKRRLWQCGLKPINLPVDVTNFVMLRDGQPMHAFDADALEGPVKVRRARKGEKILALDGREYELTPEVLVIADAVKPVAVAGVIGGLESAVSAKTRRVLLESAHFNPKVVRRSARLLGIKTESSYRFERNTDVEHLKNAQDYALSLYEKLAGATVEALRDYYLKPYEPKKIFLPMGKYIRYAGEPYRNEEASRVLTALEIPHEIKRCGIEAEVPPHRSFDLQRDVDLIEELMRVKGYDAFASEPPSLPAFPPPEEPPLDELRRFLRDRGLYEVINLPFEGSELYELLGLPQPTLRVLNPLNPSQPFLRSSLLPSLLRTALRNDRSYNYDQAFFELGKVFSLEGEELRLGLLLKGSRKTPLGEQPFSPYELSELAEGLARLLGVKLRRLRAELPFAHPYASAELLDGDELVGYLARLHPELTEKLGLRGEPLVLELYLERLLGRKRVPVYEGLSAYPPAVRDLAFLLGREESVSELVEELKKAAGELLEEVYVFDLYAGEKLGPEHKSVALRLRFRSRDSSLTDEQVNELVGRIVKKLEQKGYRLRA